MNPEKLRDRGAEINAKVTVIPFNKACIKSREKKDWSKRNFQNPK